MDYSAAPRLYPRAPDGAPSICGKPFVVDVKDHSDGLVKKILGARVEAGRPVKTIRRLRPRMLVQTFSTGREEGGIWTNVRSILEAK